MFGKIQVIRKKERIRQDICSADVNTYLIKNCKCIFDHESVKTAFPD